MTGSAIITEQMLCDATVDAQAFDDFINSLLLTVATRTGGVIPTLRGHLLSMGYGVPVPFADALSIATATQTVTHDDIVYAPTVTALPFVTTSTFDPSQWYPIQFPSARVNVANFGAVGDDVTDNAAAINAAIASVTVGGGEVFFPNTGKNYRFATPLNLKNTKNVKLVGESGFDGSGSALVYTGTGNVAAIDADGSQGFGMRDMSAKYSAGFIGRVLSLGSSSSAVSTDCVGALIENCYLGSLTPATIQTAYSVVRIGRSTDITLRHCNIQGGAYLISGQDSSRSTIHHADNVHIDTCSLLNMTNRAIFNPGHQWTITNARIGKTASGQPGGITVASAGIDCQSLVLVNPWFEDLGAVSPPNQSLIEFIGIGLSITGGRASLQTANLIRANGLCRGVSVRGMALSATTGSVFDFQTGLSGSSSSTGVELTGSMLNGLDAFYNGALPTGVLMYQTRYSPYLTIPS